MLEEKTHSLPVNSLHKDAGPAKRSTDADGTVNTCLLLINKDSGTVRDLWNDEFEESLIQKLEENGWSVDLRKVSGSQIQAEVESAKDRKLGALIAGGGDGTTSSVARLMIGSEIPLGILPFGTLNLAARDLGSPLEPLDAVAALRPNKVKEIDVLETGDSSCLCMTVIGVYPELLKRKSEFHSHSWWLKFWHLGSDFMKAFLKSPRLTLDIETGDGSRRTIKTRMVVVVPGRYEDEWGILPRREDLDSGKCSLLVSRHASMWSLFQAISKFLVGKTSADPDLEVVEADSIMIKARRMKKLLASIDGELVTLKNPVKFDMKRKALRTLDPAPENETKESSR